VYNVGRRPNDGETENPVVKITDKIDMHTHVPAEKLISKPPFPDAIKIEVTSRCNLRCSYCATGAGLRPTGDMDPEFLYRILEEARLAGVREIGLFLLGESFLLKELPEYVRRAKAAGIEYVFITTNGTLCTPQRLDAVIEAGLDSLKFSINAGTRERYAEMHGVDCFDRVMKNLEWLGTRRRSPGFRMKTSVSCIYVDSRRKELEQLREEALRHVDEFYFLPYYNQAGHVSGSEGTVGNPGRLDNMVPPIPCWGLFNSAKISWNGWLTACYFDHDSRFEIADLGKTSLLEAWHHPKFAELRQQHLDGDVACSLCAECLGCRKR
jgi:MoaA/NifB/PqqE/SkfB family radical SAM enzyme